MARAARECRIGSRATSASAAVALFLVLEGQKSFARGVKIGPARLLQNHRPPKGQIHCATITKPATARADVAILRHAKFSAALRSVIAVALPRTVQGPGTDQTPAAFAKARAHRVVLV